MAYRTMVKVIEPILDEDDNPVLDEDEKETFTEELYYLLHWGLTYEIRTHEDQYFTVSYTIGICQHIKSGAIMSFVPQLLTVVGKERIL